VNRTRIEEQIGFLLEIDKVKNVFRQTRILDGSRRENDAEHAWHLAVMALVLSETANRMDLDLLKVVKMVLIHDLVEIDTGDTLVYDSAAREERKREEVEAAARIFGLLPEDQAQDFLDLWEEFEARRTPEARFAACLDRLEPILQNVAQGGKLWREKGLTRKRVEDVNRHMREGSEALWAYARRLMEECEEKGAFAGEEDDG